MREENNTGKGKSRILVKKWLVIIVFAAITSSVVSIVITGHLWDVSNLLTNLRSLRKWVSLERAILVFPVFVYLIAHFFFPIREMYNWMFKWRWALGLLLLLFLTINRFHGDSIGFYYDAVQPGVGEQSSMPFYGKIRPIRSDEFVVNTPSVLASGYGDTPYGKYNDIIRGTDTLNIVLGAYGGYATLACAPWELSYLVLPTEFAFSFCWYAPLILAFLLSFEMYLIITKRRRLLSLAGAFLTVLSPFVFWWSIPGFMISAPGTIICLYHFLHKKKVWQKILLGCGVAVSFANFVVILYPAWQVPVGYMFLAIGIWLLHDNWERIKRLSKRDWFIVGICIVFMISLILSYFYVAADYIKSVSNTVYPGARSEVGGGGISKLFYYTQAPFYAFKDIANASEASVFLSFFPIPMVMATYLWLKSKKKDWLTPGLIIVSIPMILFVTTGLPEVVAKLTLFSNSMPGRMVDIIGFIQIYFIMIIFSRYEDVKKSNFVIGGLLGLATACICVWFSRQDFPGYLSRIETVLILIVVALLGASLVIRVSKKTETLIFISMIVFSIGSTFYIRPVSVGLAAFYSKPVAKEISRVCTENPDAKWIAYGGGHVLPQYNIACGASTINSVNAYPNLELWEKLDEKDKYEDIYNRYAHVNVEFTNGETEFTLNQADYMNVIMSYKDIKKTGVSYVLATGDKSQLVDNEYVSFEKIYDEYGTAIYQIVYK